jgi:hypothetical protein
MRLAHVAILLAAAVASGHAQWLNYRDPATPRTPDGKANLAAQAPRASDGKPDLSGVWVGEPTPGDEMLRLFGDLSAFAVPGDDLRQINKYALNILADYKPAEAPMRPEAAKVFHTRSGELGKDISTSHCLPAGLPLGDFLPFKVVQTPRLIVMLAEGDNTRRQLYTDGRKLPPDPQPTWLGYSVGRWEGDTLVVDTAGFNDKTWLDAFGHPHSEVLRLEERFHRRDFGHMEIELTVDDPQMYTKSFTVKFNQRLIPDSDILESICNENEKDRPHLQSQ